MRLAAHLSAIPGSPARNALPTRPAAGPGRRTLRPLGSADRSGTPPTVGGVFAAALLLATAWPLAAQADTARGRHADARPRLVRRFRHPAAVAGPGAQHRRLTRTGAVTGDPLDEPGIAVDEGDYVLAVNGVAFDPSRDPMAALRMKWCARPTTTTARSTPCTPKSRGS